MKHPWEMERKILEEGIPRPLSEKEQTWNMMDKVEEDEDNRTKSFWASNVPGSYAQEKLAYGAAQSMENMGYDITGVMEILANGDKELEAGDMSALCRTTTELLFKLNSLPIDKSHPYHNYKIYNTFEEYKSSVPNMTKKPIEYSKELLEEKTLAGWQAQIIGGAVGTALEGYTYENIKKVFGDVRGYVRKPNTMNDDITFELAFLDAFEKKKTAITSEDIALEWQAQIPGGWSAEDIALRNIRLGIVPPQSGYLHNPFREWIGAQMRGAVCGMVAPGNPMLAAELAFKDAVVSHHNNGVIGEVFNAVFVSLSYVIDDVREILKLSVDMTPSDSEYGSVVRFAMECCQNSSNWLEAFQKCDEKYKKYNWIHVYPNACAQLIALWFGNGDFLETLHIVSMVGMDVDCNAAQILTAIGIMKGLRAIPQDLINPIGDNLITYLRDYKKTSISQLAKRTVELSIL